MHDPAPRPLIDPQRAGELVRQFPHKRLLVIGDVMLDRYVIGKVERLNPEAPVPILHAKKESMATGGAGNTAKNAASLGGSATLVSVVGADRTAKDLHETAGKEGYQAVLIADSGRPTIVKQRFIVSSQQMLRVDYEESHSIPASVEAELIAAIDAAAAKTDAIIVSDYAKGLLTRPVSAAIMAAAARHNLPIMADVKPSHIEQFKGVTYISPNRKEAHEYLGLNQHLQGGCPNDQLAARLHETFHASVFLTLSEDGMYIRSQDTNGVHVPQVHKVEVADTSGCGDTAAVAILLAKLCGATDVEAAHIGNAAGAVIAGKIGAVALTPRELLQALASS